MYMKPLVMIVMVNGLMLLLAPLMTLGDDYSETSGLKSEYAVQAAATLGEFVFAIDSRRIAKYHRDSGEFLGLSQGEAIHLNSGYVWKKKVLCAHSNYPNVPERSQVMLLEPNEMLLTPWRDFGDYGGSLTWIVRRGSRWLCNFANYGEKNKETFLVEFDSKFTEKKRWIYPSEIIAKLGNYSLSGGIWLRGELLVTGHDEKEVYVLKVPKQGSRLQYVETRSAPFTGQGIAIDKHRQGLVGISRAERRVIFAK